MKNVISFAELSLKDLLEVGGKNASLGEMIKHLSIVGVKVPNGFATTVSAYQLFLSQNNLDNKIYSVLNSLNTKKLESLKKTSENIRQWILSTPFSLEFEKDVIQAYTNFNDGKEISVAVRSSATSEDLPEASFAGQQESFLNICGSKDVLLAIKKVFASLFTERAIMYRIHHGFDHAKVGISAGIQRMVKCDQGVSGVMFTLDTESGFDQVILINASYGLGEAIVQGKVNPDEFCVHKPTLLKGKFAILRRQLGEKEIKVVYSNQGDSKESLKIIPVTKEQQIQFCIKDQDILILAKQALLIEQHYGRAMDIEWAKDSVDGELYILQARPETVQSLKKEQYIKNYHIQGRSDVLTIGRSVGQKIGQGIARIIADPKDMHELQTKEVLVTDMTDPDWEPIMKLASAIVTNRGGRTCHAAIVARELGIPAIVGCGNATSKIISGQEVTVSCAEGEKGYVYDGLLKYQEEKIAVSNMPKLSIKLCINLGNPDKAFSLQYLPNDGVGLARMEFIISQMIGIHPNAILNLEKLPDAIREEVIDKTAAYESPKEFYIEKLREGMSTIAAAFYPKQAIFRFSDFKSNEYANLLGGNEFEPKEENPMLGFRGASRYISDNFKNCFALECEAFKRVRNDMDLTNAQIMIPFVRTITEVKNIIGLMTSYGLTRGENDLKIYMMCEIPSNALLAEKFLEFVDGFSIGSNDLTQLTLGLDRDSELVASLFDERDDAVKLLLHYAISACKKANKYVGICGQAPSDYPELARWLMEEGIESISLNPDSIINTWLYLAK